MEFSIESEFTTINTALQEGSITRAEALAQQMKVVDHVILLAQRGLLGGEIPRPEPTHYATTAQLHRSLTSSDARLLYPDDEDGL